MTDALDEEPHNRFADSLAKDEDQRPATKRAAADKPSSFPPAVRGPAAPPGTHPRRHGAQCRRDFGSRARRERGRSGNPAVGHGGVRRLRASSGPRPNLSSPMVSRDRGSCWSAKPRARTRTGASGTLFVGRAGQLLDRMLSAIGLDRSGVYIANVVPRAPARQPDPDAPGDASLPAVHGASDRARRSGKFPSASAPPRFVPFSGSRPGSSARAAPGLPIGAARGARSALSPPITPPTSCGQPGEKRLAWADLRALAAALGIPPRL